MIPELEQLATESAGADGFKLDQMSPLEIVTAMNRADREIPYAIEPHLNQIARVAEWGIESIRRGGRIFYMGAGTSGRLGVLDAAECPPTFGVSFDTVIGLIAVGKIFKLDKIKMA
jgi:N-acetylmuramic acid 6-phosphate etherase